MFRPSNRVIPTGTDHRKAMVRAVEGPGVIKGWPTFTFFVKVGRKHRRRERKIRMQAARVPTFAKTAKVGQHAKRFLNLVSHKNVAAHLFRTFKPNPHPDRNRWSQSDDLCSGGTGVVTARAVPVPRPLLVILRQRSRSLTSGSQRRISARRGDRGWPAPAWS
jgi:hypothetical protein